MAGSLSAVVEVDLAEDTVSAMGTGTLNSIHHIVTHATVSTRVRSAVIDVVLTVKSLSLIHI